MYYTSPPDAGPYAEPPTRPKHRRQRVPPSALVSDITAGVLVLILTLATAWAGYQGGLADGKEAEENLLGQRNLSDASTFALAATQVVVADASAMDSYFVHRNDPELSEYFQGRFSAELTASFDLVTGELDTNTYLGSVFTSATASSDESDRHFAEAERAGNAADSYQLVVLVMALALALAGLATLRQRDADGWSRGLLTLGALVMLVFGGLVLMTIDVIQLKG